MSVTILNDATFEFLVQEHGEDFIRNLGFRPETEKFKESCPRCHWLHEALERAAKEKMEQNFRIVELENKLTKVKELLNDFQASECKAAKECAKCGIEHCALRELEALLSE